MYIHVLAALAVCTGEDMAFQKGTSVFNIEQRTDF